jgi:hypothetical protein
MVQAGVPGTVAPKKLTVLGDPFVQPTVVAPLHPQGAEKAHVDMPKRTIPPVKAE